MLLKMSTEQALREGERRAKRGLFAATVPDHRDPDSVSFLCRSQDELMTVMGLLGLMKPERTY